MEHTFKRLYQKLNSAQKQAVDTIEGPVMVIAGPGTGKTQVLTLRIANILRKTDASPDSILVLTFTESGVFSIRERLVQIMGSTGYRVHVHTFHSFAKTIIDRFPDAFEKIIGGVPISDVDRIALIEGLLRSGAYKTLAPFGNASFYVRPILRALSELKRENMKPRDVKKRLKADVKILKENSDAYHQSGPRAGALKASYEGELRRLIRTLEFADLYEVYEQSLHERRVYDYEDMIIETIKALEAHENILRELQEEYQYLLADEHQDANQSQNRLLELLSAYHPSPNLFIVGDVKQAIYRFQGASLENFRYFERLYPEADIITLKQSYRSPQSILDASHALMTHADSELTGNQHLKSTPFRRGSLIELRVFSNELMEHTFAAVDIKQRIKAGIPSEKIAIFYRMNKDVIPLTRVLAHHGIPFTVESEQDALSDPHIMRLLLLIRAISAFGNDALLGSALHAHFLDVPPLALYRATHYAHQTSRPLIDILKSHTALSKASIKEPSQLSKIVEMLESLKMIGENESLPVFLEELITRTHFLAYAKDSLQSALLSEKLRGLFNMVNALSKANPAYRLGDLVHQLDLMSQYGVGVQPDRNDGTPSGVHLMTVHKAKGMEFDVVYIVGAYDGHFGNQRSAHYFELPSAGKDGVQKTVLDDERRLFFVALTRARRACLISYPKEQSGSGRALPSVFIEEIPKRFIKEVDTKPFETSVSAQAIFYARKQKRAGSAEREYLRSLFLSQGFSVTALNNYLICPWNYFYNNLIRLPKALDQSALFGTAIHQALKRFFDAHARGKALGKARLLSFFRDALARVPLSEPSRAQALARGEEALSGYYDHYKHEWSRTIKNEFRVTVTLPIRVARGFDTHLPLRGDLDKVEFLNGRDVSVVDYKTGTPKSRAFIEGKTKHSIGAYKRQLTFYKLLLSRFAGGRYHMANGCIDFVEPDKRGVYHKERYIISDDDIALLSKLIEEKASEIYSLSFWNSRCADSRCAYCSLRYLAVPKPASSSSK